jgi:SAM-dependent methyltransferase
MAETELIFNDGEAYERSMGRWSRRVAVQFLDWVAPARDLDWLDVGCGNGAFTETLVARCAPRSVTAIDPSPGQIAYARAHVGTRPIDYQLGNAMDIPFEANRFDATSMALVIAFVPDPQKAVSEMARVTRPAGPVATYMWDFANAGVPSSPIAREMKRMGVLPAQPYAADTARPEQLRAMWTQAGFTDIETTTLTIDVAFDDFDDFWTSFAHGGATAKMLATLDPEVVARVRAAVQAALPAGPDGRIAYQGRANAIKGRAAA